MMNGMRLMLPMSAESSSARKRTLAPVIPAECIPSSAAELVYVRDHHHSVLYRDAKDGDQAHDAGTLSGKPEINRKNVLPTRAIGILNMIVNVFLSEPKQA